MSAFQSSVTIFMRSWRKPFCGDATYTWVSFVRNLSPFFFIWASRSENILSTPMLTPTHGTCAFIAFWWFNYERLRKTITRFRDQFQFCTSCWEIVSRHWVIFGLGFLFFRWDISFICLVLVLKLTVTVFTSLPYQALWPNLLKFFRSFQNNFGLRLEN